LNIHLFFQKPIPPIPPIPPPPPTKIEEKSNLITNKLIHGYVLPPIPPAASFSGLGASTTTASAVINNEATPLASCNADRTTYRRIIFKINRKENIVIL
jgi:hypothetical protein